MSSLSLEAFNEKCIARGVDYDRDDSDLGLNKVHSSTMSTTASP